MCWSEIQLGETCHAHWAAQSVTTWGVVESEGLLGGAFSQLEIMTPRSPLTCTQPSPEGQQVPRLAPLSCDRNQVCPCEGSSVEALQTTSFPFLGNRPPAFVLSLSTPPAQPISQFFFSPDIIKNCLNHPATT